MRYSKKAIREFIEIWKEEFGEELDEEQAEIQINRLMEMVSTIFIIKDK